MMHVATMEVPSGAAPHIAAPARVHMVGIAGSGMRSLADVLTDAGWSIRGSDLEPSTFNRATLDVRRGHHADAIDPSIDLVVYSNAVPPDNPELCRARQLGIPTLSYPDMLGKLMQSHRGVAIAGTHGKSTTTAMAGEILTAAELDPTVVVGATPVDGHASGRHGQGCWMLAEACEYRAGFHHLQPEMAAILNIESDHFDCFDTPAALTGAFARFAQSVPADGLMLARAECAATQLACAELSCRTETFGESPDATWQATELRQRRGYYTFQLRNREHRVGELKLSVPGRHNVLNATAAAALASHCGAPAASIQAGLERFAGLRQRLQLLGEVRGVALVDDYAHHPTEVAAALATLREMYADRRLWCVFQPHQVSRLTRLLDEFAHSLRNADKVVVADVYRAREHAASGNEVTAGHLAERVARQGGDVVQLASAVEIRDHLRRSLRPGDVLVTMGAGDIGKVAYELGQGFRTFRQAG